MTLNSICVLSQVHTNAHRIRRRISKCFSSNTLFFQTQRQHDDSSEGCGAAQASPSTRGPLLHVPAPHVHAEPPRRVRLLSQAHPGGQELGLQAVQLHVREDGQALPVGGAQIGQEGRVSLSRPIPTGQQFQIRGKQFPRVLVGTVFTNFQGVTITVCRNGKVVAVQREYLFEEKVSHPSMLHPLVKFCFAQKKSILRSLVMSTCQ